MKKFDSNVDEKLEKIFENRPTRSMDYRQFKPLPNRRWNIIKILIYGNKLRSNKREVKGLWFAN